MTVPESTPSNSPSAAPHPDHPERRRNPRLRVLIDEMLASVRAAANIDLWTTEERARAHDELARIMASVRAHAIDHGQG